MQTSIVMPTYIFNNELHEITKKCISTIREFTENFQFIIVDNGSSEEFTKTLRDNADIYIWNKENISFAKAVNQGLKLAQGNYLVVANNDIEVTENWLEPLISASNEQKGVVCPTEPDRHSDREFAGWCWLMSRDVFNVLGCLDERYEVATFEDTDYWAKVLSLGLILKRVRNSIVYHKYPSSTFRKMPNNDEIFQKNRIRFIEKWGFKPEEKGL